METAPWPGAGKDRAYTGTCKVVRGQLTLGGVAVRRGAQCDQHLRKVGQRLVCVELTYTMGMHAAAWPGPPAQRLLKRAAEAANRLVADCTAAGRLLNMLCRPGESPRRARRLAPPQQACLLCRGRHSIWVCFNRRLHRQQGWTPNAPITVIVTSPCPGPGPCARGLEGVNRRSE